MTLHDVLFILLAVLTAISALAVVVVQNIVRAATWLLFALAGTAGVFFLLGADFLGATQLLIYVGGTLVLVVFGVMLTAQGPFINLRTSAVEWGVSLVVGVLLFGVLAVVTTTSAWDLGTPTKEQKTALTDTATSSNAIKLGVGFLGGPVGPDGHGGRVGRRVLGTGYLLPFEIVSVHLLVVLIGAAYLARAKRRRGVADATR